MIRVTKSFAAIELTEDEPDIRAVQRFMEAANDLGIRFKILESFGILTVGRNKFLRFRTDARNLEGIAKKLGNGYIVANSRGAYDVHLRGRTGKIGCSVVQESVSQPVKYRGTMDEFWNRQFTVEPKKHRGLA